MADLFSTLVAIQPSGSGVKGTTPINGSTPLLKGGITSSRAVATGSTTIKRPTVLSSLNAVVVP